MVQERCSSEAMDCTSPPIQVSSWVFFFFFFFVVFVFRTKYSQNLFVSGLFTRLGLAFMKLTLTPLSGPITSEVLDVRIRL